MNSAYSEKSSIDVLLHLYALRPYHRGLKGWISLVHADLTMGSVATAD